MLRGHPGPTCPAGPDSFQPEFAVTWRGRGECTLLPPPSCPLSPHLRVGGRWVTPASNLGLCRCNSSPLASPHFLPSSCVPSLGVTTEARGGGVPRSHLVPSLPPCSFFCPEGTSSVLGHDCPSGYYCPASTAFASQFPCPRGTYKPQRGGVQPTDCTPCEPGKGAGLHPWPARPRPGSPQLAREGRTQAWIRWGVIGPQPQSTFAGWGTPILPCPPAPEDPVSPTGFYCLLPGLAAVSGPCSAGFHCSRGASVPSPTDGVTGDLCPPGHFCPQGSPRPAPCPAGESPTASASPEVCSVFLKEGRSRGTALGTLPGSDTEDSQLHLAASIHPAPT